MAQFGRNSFTWLAGLLALTGAAGGQVPPHSEVPIREVVLSDGERRYTIPITVGGTAIEAGLDTGSTGLRILPNTLAASDAAGSGDSDHYSYGAGTEFQGEIGKGQLAIGGSAAPTTMQLIQTVRCVFSNPHCPASRVPIDKFGIQGSGLPGEGFRAIIGVNMAEADVASPLPAIGTKRWIVELPRPGAGAPGKLILNPTDEEVKDYVRLPILDTFAFYKGGLHDAVDGCLINVATKGKSCGALMMDTGAPGIRLVNGTLGHKPWDNGTAAALAFYSAGSPKAVEYLTIGSRDHASHLEFGDEESQIRGPVIYSGLSPYFAFDILYDPANRQIGIKPRAPADNAPTGRFVTGN